MKGLLFFFALLFSFQLSAQEFEYADRWGNAIYNFTILDDGSYFLAGNDGHLGANSSLFLLDGTRLEIPFSPIEAYNFQFKIDPTGGYLVSYELWDCDYKFARIIKLNDAGELVWFTGANLFIQLVDIDVFQNGDILASTKTKLFKLNNNAQPIWNLELGQDISDFVVDSLSYIYVALPDSISKLDEDGNSLGIASNVSVQNLRVLENHDIAAYDSTAVYFFDSELNLLNTVEITSVDYIVDVAFGQDFFSVLYGDDFFSLNKKVKTFDYSLNELGAFDLDDNQISWQGIGIREAEIFLAGQEFYGLGFEGSVVKNFAVDGSTIDYMEDVALFDLEIDSLGSDTLIFYGPKMTLQNNGIDTLNSVWVSVLIGYTPGWICRFREIISEEFMNLSLPPGESVQLELPDLFYKDAWFNDVDLCYYAHLPNRHMDFDNSNNFSCLNFYVNSEEIFSENIALEIYPNPTSSFLNIKSENNFLENMQMSIVNNYGQIMEDVFLEKRNSEFQIKINDWPSGIYYLKIVQNENVFTRRFVKN